MDIFLNTLGILGVLLVLIAYFMLQKGKLSLSNPAYHLLNIAGSLGIIASLTISWNLPSFIIQCCWIAISLYGLVKNTRISLFKR